MKTNTPSSLKVIGILVTILLVSVSLAVIYFYTMDTFIIGFTMILASSALFCFFVQIKSRHNAKIINLVTFSPFNRTISKYFVSANTFIIFSIIILILTLVVSHEVWEICELDKKISIGIFGGGLLIASYFFNAGIKLHTEMRDKSLEYIQEHRKNEELKDSIRLVIKYFSDLKKSNLTFDKDRILTLEQKNKELYSKIRDVAGFFEEIAISIRYREAQETLLEEYFLFLFLFFFQSIDNDGNGFIKYIREQNTVNDISAHEIFYNLEYLNARWQRFTEYDKEIYTSVNKRWDWDKINKSKVSSPVKQKIDSIANFLYVAFVIYLFVLIFWFLSHYFFVKKQELETECSLTTINETVRSNKLK